MDDVDRELSPLPELQMPAGVRIAPAAITFAASRASGPGGQNVNKVNTRIELRMPLAAVHGLSPEQFARLRTLLGRKLSAAGEVRLVCQESRSQELNRRSAVQQLARLIEEAWQLPTRRRPTRPSRGARRRRIESKKHRSATKDSRRETRE